VVENPAAVVESMKLFIDEPAYPDKKQQLYIDVVF